MRGALRRAWTAFRGWPTWAQAASWVVLGLVILGAAVTPPEADKATDVVADTATTATPAPAAPATATPRTTRTTAARTLSEQITIISNRFDGMRESLAEAIESDFGPSDVQSVDRLVFDPAVPAVLVDLTSAYRGEELVADAAWEVRRSMVAVWQIDTFTEFPDAAPALHLTINDQAYQCPAAFMIRLSD
ncbi:MAG TPA: hypothetical protein VNA57_02065, partial [Acidimicrobiales bacterium]|nr:hypothetical protein [Acidimicrobiales bacterium]